MPPMAYYHYTSRHAAQNVICGDPSLIRPGRSGKVFLSPIRYQYGHEAAGELGIENPVEMVCQIPESVVSVLSEATRVERIINADGTVIRRGRGWEVNCMAPIPAAKCPWSQVLDP